MAETITGGYYLELDQKTGKPARAHNANSQEVKLLSDAEIESLKESGEPAPLVGPENADAAALASQQAASKPAKAKRAKKPKK